MTVSNSNRDRLLELADEILLNQRQSTFIPSDLPTAAEKRSAKYSIGAALKEARKLMPSDVEFGEWVLSEINDQLLASEEKAIPQKTLYNYRMLAEFGSEDECGQIGFNNIYTLMQEGNEELRSEIRGMFDGHIKPADSDIPFTTTEVVVHAKALLKPEKEKTYTQAELDAMLDGFIDEDVLDNIRTETDRAAKIAVYAKALHIDPETLCESVLKAAYHAATKKFHPDKTDEPELFAADFQFAKEAYEFLRKNLI